MIGDNLKIPIMHLGSYKYHLSLLKQKQKPAFLKKTSYLIMAILILSAGMVSSLIIWQYQSEAPIRAENAYLSTVSDGFNSAKQAINETLETFQVAGAKTVVVDSLKQASSTAFPQGYQVLLEDIDKTAAKIETAQKVIKIKKLDLLNQQIPDKFSKLNNDLISFYDLAINTFEDSQKDINFAKEILVATGQTLYLPSLSDESLWALKNEQQIKNFYLNKKEELNITLTSMARLNTPQSFKTYYDLQMEYLTGLAQLSDSIVNILSQKDDTNPDNALQIEKAYQVLNAAKTPNEQLAAKLLTERTKVFDLKNNFQVYAPVRISQNSLEEKILGIYEHQPQIKTVYLPDLLSNIISKVTTFFHPLQTPSVI